MMGARRIKRESLLRARSRYEEVAKIYVHYVVALQRQGEREAELIRQFHRWTTRMALLEQHASGDDDLRTALVEALEDLGDSIDFWGEMRESYETMLDEANENLAHFEASFRHDKARYLAEGAPVADIELPALDDIDREPIEAYFDQQAALVEMKTEECGDADRRRFSERLFASWEASLGVGLPPAPGGTN